MTRVPTACALLLAAMIPVHALGKDEAQGSLREGDRVRVAAPSVGPKRVVGQALAVQESRLRLKLENGREMDIDRADIRELEVSRGQRSQVGKGAAAGALVGATLGLGALVATRGVCDEDLGGCEAYGRLALIGAAAGTVVGSLAGLQSRTDRWEKVSPAAQVALVVGPGRASGLEARLSIAF